jgi:ABC-2 type transport system permease protein
MPQLVQDVMLFAPTTHFVELGQAILYRGAGIETVLEALSVAGGNRRRAVLAVADAVQKTLSSMA